ncbi:hypothetical protein H9623_13170 [Oerskovia sp. Sa1BUA8]|uniref:Uncharacterized protein n=1 Tax=Oerskovia douganii TaxID=2762210 RepID=A0A9D5UIM7_9CELL|nr:hypothetical protein [Oerskovia douganii]MBE7701247.1 hypothetical protein [Oerskovia douganii]
MSLADTHARIAPKVPRPRTAPTGFEPGVKYDAGEPSVVTLALKEIPDDEKQWRDEIKRVTTLDLPDHRRVEIQQVRYWGDPKDPMVYVRFGIRDRDHADGPAVDHAELVRVAKTNRRTPATKTKTGRTRVTVLADPQIGKVDQHGGTPELYNRLEDMLTQHDQIVRETPCDDAVILDPGDLTEGFENTAQQAHTNDLSFPEQLRHARVILTNVVTRLAARHRSTLVATVPSNHTQWRRGKDRLGKPGDDFGLETHRAVADALTLAKRGDITFTMPDPWEESLALTVRGAIIGLVHGHQARSGQFPTWWAKQTHGDQPLAAATIAVTGHYHSFSMQPTGAVDGRAKYWIQAPALDGGSSWWRHLSGDTSEPGIVTFTVDDEGNWDNLRVIRPRVKIPCLQAPAPDLGLA